MKIGKYIHELLLENETVIIPGFGAFISNYKPAEINNETDEIKPPSKEISFNQQIRNNDGLLVGHIADTEEISHFDALKSIEKERENLIYQLDKGEKVTLEKTGILFYNEKNEIYFEPYQDENLLLESFGLESVSLSTKEENTNETVPLVSPIETNDNDSVDDVVPEQEEISQEVQETPVSEIPKTEVQEEPPTEIITEPDPELVPITNQETKPEPEEKKKRGWVWYLLILLPIIIAGIFIVKNNANKEPVVTENKEKEIPKIVTEPEKTEIVLIDSLVSDSLQKSTIDTTTISVKEEIAQINPELPIYYLVGGSFKEEANAKKYFDQLKSDGYEPFHLGKRGNFYIVGIGKYTSGKEAVKAKKEFITNNPGSEIWIKKE